MVLVVCVEAGDKNLKGRLSLCIRVKISHFDVHFLLGFFLSLFIIK